MNVVWLHNPTLSQGMIRMAQAYVRRAGINVFDVKFKSLTKGCLVKKTATKWVPNEDKKPQFFNDLASTNPDFIVCNDRAALGYITGKYTSLALCRGGIYKCVLPSGRIVACLVIDELLKTKTTKTGGWVLLNDLQKLQRWLSGNLRKEAKFNYKVLKEVADVKAFVKELPEIEAMAVDIETTAVYISCIGYTCLFKDGRVHTYVIPFINPNKKGGCQWDEDYEESTVWEYVRQINASPCYKIMQNGSYDATYFVVYLVPLYNYVADTLHAWHSIWCEAPKRLDFIASICMDTYQFWKDEGKEDAKDDTKGGKIPKTPEGLENYWRYNALDCHNTLHSWLFILRVLCKQDLEWAAQNYRTEMRQQFGPAFAMSMRGTKCNKTLQTYFAIELQTKADKAKQELVWASGDDNYNPNSPPQTQELLYDIFKLKPYGKKGRTTDEKILRMIKEQNIFADWFVEQLWKAKKPAALVGKYGSGVTLHGRFMYKMSAAATETGRYGSKAHDLWVGTNVQNVPYIMRPMLEADDGYVLFDIDYAQSDAYFTAFDLEELNFIETMLSDKDTHCVHAAFFFKLAYEKLAAAHANKEPWCSHNQTGVRSITKRVVYGANYEMQGPTLLITMTRKPVIAAAEQLGYKDAATWTDKQLAKLCDAFLQKYFQMYPGLKPALARYLKEAAARGNIYTCAFGRTRLFFGNLGDAKIQREFAAFIGQGGTAGNINKALDNIFYGFKDRNGNDRRLEEEGVQLLFQVHDSIIGQVPNDRIELISDVQDAMNNQCELHGRTFTVPTEADVGLGWGKRLRSYHEGITLAEIQEHDAKWWDKWRAGETV